MKIISLHLPKTGGTSFYHVLQQVYGRQNVSISYRRRDYLAEVAKGNWEASVARDLQVLHGHFYYKEVEQLHRTTDAKLITWLRDPIQRVISNYHFFLAGLQNPARNPRDYVLNKHRRNETLLEYAARPECCNRMTSFLAGAELSDFYFIGLLENFTQDVNRLSEKLNWSVYEIPKKNVAKQSAPDVAPETLRLLRKWNDQDIALYEQVVAGNRLKN